jgi:hypothetical protein
VPILVTAGGTAANGTGPKFTLLVNGTPIGSVAEVATSAAPFDPNDPASWTDYAFTWTGGDPIETVEVVYGNDVFNQTTGEDRNLWVDKIEVDGQTYEAEQSGDVVLDYAGLEQYEGPREDMITDGTMTFDLMPDGDLHTVSLRVGGDTATGAPDPAFEVWVDGAKVGSGTATQSDKANWEEFDFDFYTDPGVDPQSVEVRYTNDTFDPNTGADTNLYVDWVSLDGEQQEAENEGTFTNVWDGTSAGGFGEAMWTSGTLAFDFSDPVGTMQQLTVRASGDEANGEQAAFSLKVDGVTVGTQTVTASYQDYVFTWASETTPDDVEITFVNDLYDDSDPNAVQDRNLYVDRIETEDGTLVESELAGTLTANVSFPGVENFLNDPEELLIPATLSFDLENDGGLATT